MDKNTNFIIIEKIEKVQDEYGLTKTKIIGKSNKGNELNFIVDDWVNVNFGTKLEFVKKIVSNKLRYELIDDSFIHPVFEKNKFYKFIYLGEIDKNKIGKDNLKILKFKGIDNRQYEVFKRNQSFSNNEIGKEFELQLINISNGRAIFYIRYNFYSIENIKHIEFITECFNELENIDKTDLSIQIIDQYNKQDNRWIITFIRHLESRSWECFTRKDWLTFYKYCESIKKLQDWILTSKYLMLYGKEKVEDIQKIIKKQRQYIEIKEKAVYLNQNFKEVEYITSLKIDDIKEGDYQILGYLIRSNNELIRDKKVLQFFYDCVLKNNLKIEFIKYLVTNIENAISQLSKLIFTLKTNELDIKQNQINKLLFLYIFIHNVSVKIDSKIKVQIFQLRLCNVLSQTKKFQDLEILELKGKILTKEIKYQIFDNLLNISPETVFLFLKNLEIRNSINNILSIGQKINCLVLFKSNFGVLVKSQIGSYGILPKQQLTKTRYENLKENSELELVVNYYNSELNLFVPGLKRVDVKIENTFKENKKLFDNYTFETGQVVECTVRRVEYFGVYVNVTETQSGLLRVNRIYSKYLGNIFDWFYIGQKVNLVVISHIYDKIEMSQTDLINHSVTKYTNPVKTNIKIRSIQNNNVYILIDDLLDYTLKIDELKISTYLNIHEVIEFNCLFSIENYQVIISAITDIKPKKLKITNEEISQRDIQQLITEKTYVFEEIINSIDDLDLKIENLNWCKIVYSQFSNHRSYFIDYYISYFNIIKLFFKNDSNITYEIQNFIEKVEQDNKVKDSFDIINKIRTILNIVLYFNIVTEESFSYLSKMFFIDDYKNISRLVMSNNLIESSIKNTTYKEKIYKLLLLNSKLTDIHFSYEDTYELEDDNSEIRELLSLINKGENKVIEFKSSLYTPIEDGQTKTSNFNTDILVHSVMKNIVGFVNSKGGKLFIGVSDSGEIIGLDADFSKFYKDVEKSDRKKLIDRFLLTLDNYIDNWIGNDIRKYIQVEIHNWRGKDFCVIHLSEKEKDKPYMVNHSIDKNTTLKNQKECYLRTEAGVKKLSVEDIITILT